MNFDTNKMNIEARNLLQKLIRNKCVNDGSEASGNEMRSVATLVEYFKSYSITDYEIFKTSETRGNLLVKIKGSDSKAESLMYQSHIDVVPANSESWDVDPFEAVIKDDFLWGRGTIDMLIFTATQAVAFAHLYKNGFQPNGDLIFLAVADEEAGGKFGAQWLVDNVPEKIKADYLIGEFGGAVIDTPKGKKAGLMIAEKGPAWFKMTVRGSPGHASMSYETDNALFTASKILQLIKENPPKAYFCNAWYEFVRGLEVGFVSKFMLTHSFTINFAINKLAKKDIGLARAFHGLSHMTINPTIIHGGTKTNVIPDKVELDFDVRLLPEQTKNTVIKYIEDTLGEKLMNKIELEHGMTSSGSSDPWDTDLIKSMGNVYRTLIPTSDITPLFLPAVTDSRIFRTIGIKCYGFCVLTENVSLNDLSTWTHGNNERIPLEAIDKTTQFFAKLAVEFLG